MVVYGFTTHIFTPQDWELAQRSLLQLRALYPESPIACIADGCNPPDYREFCNELEIEYILGDRLKLLSSGGAWLERWLLNGAKQGTEWIARLDSDTYYLRRLNGLPPNTDAVGTPWRDFVAGCFVRQSAVIRILESKLLRDLRYTEPEYGYRRYLHHRFEDEEPNAEAIAVCDAILADVFKRLNLTFAPWSEINHQWREQPDADPNKWAVIHPYR